MTWGPGFVIAIVAIIVFGRVIREYLRGKREETPGHDEEWETTVTRLQELEDRVRVLERIVTDPKESLSREIHRL